MSQPPPPSSPSEDLTRSVVDVIDAAFGVGVALARTAARVTAPTSEVATPVNDAPIPAMIHYSLAAATNLVGMVTTAISAGGRAAAPAPGQAPASRGGPRVRAGTTLRVPLSIENPGERPMTGLAPLVRAIRQEGVEAVGLSAKDIRFAPASLEVAPRDFEKLTVFVTVPETAAPGRYEVVLALKDDGEDLPLSFEVAAPE
ncbi:hypothetical protein LJR225_002889 [Phenylobacterium sp. LjRoot225]|uniref:hypothetical protein n=1 Tax=Phenylobacterium sp. LjRoot225 TaxID=3342285 RepID=UPI003ECCA793